MGISCFFVHWDSYNKTEKNFLIMPLSWNQIRKNAVSYSKKWENEKRERAEKDSFWNDFFSVFGMDRKRVASFEEPVKKLGGSQGFIDLFWKGMLLVEHKSRGKDLVLKASIGDIPGAPGILFVCR